MAFNYSGNPSDSDLDEVRYLIHDTDSDDYHLEDAEINYHINNEGSNLQAAIKAAEQIAISLADKADSVDAEEVSAEFRSQSDRYWKVAKKLDSRKAESGSGAKQLSTGTTLWNDDPDKQFEIGQFDNNERF